MTARAKQALAGMPCAIKTAIFGLSVINFLARKIIMSWIAMKDIVIIIIPIHNEPKKHIYWDIVISHCLLRNMVKGDKNAMDKSASLRILPVCNARLKFLISQVAKYTWSSIYEKTMVRNINIKESFIRFLARL